MTSHQLKAAAANESLQGRQEAVNWKGKTTQGTFHLFLNETSEEVDLFWFYEGGERKHGSMAPKGTMYIGALVRA